jgi:lipopolysaccharide export system permease protein
MAAVKTGGDVSRLDRYLLWQFLSLFGFFALVLVAVYWVNRAVRLFDQLISNGQSAWVFLEFTVLSLPPMIRIILPLAAFIATVYATNRLSGDSELTAAQAAGISPWRMLRPVLAFGLIATAMVAVLMNVLEPISNRKLDARRIEVQADKSSQFLVEGTFVHPAGGVTLYIREIADTGELQDVLIVDARDPRSETTYTARRAALARSASGADSGTGGDAAGGGPKILMFDGMAQRLSRDDGMLSVTRFGELSYDISGLLTGPDAAGPRPEHLATARLLAALPQTQAETGLSRAVLQAEGHSRLAQPLLALAGAMIGFSALLTGTFSRFGLWRQIGVGVTALVAVQFLANFASTVARDGTGDWPVLYIPPAVGIAIALGLTTLAAAPRRRRPLAAAPA